MFALDDVAYLSVQAEVRAAAWQQERAVPARAVGWRAARDELLLLKRKPSLFVM